ncbi:MAG: preprotein translocase subunit YajC [Victivallales bacterium]|jgi:preprotein translocase subunit YajC|nr:preprotein translocase subunit YajC [Victivallales bacterium]
MSLNFILADVAAQSTTTIGPGAAPGASANTANSVQVVATDTTAATQQVQPPIWGNPIILMLVVLGVMFFFTFRSQKKQQQKRQKMLDTIAKGTRVMLNTGMFGTVVEVKAKSYMVEIADKVVVEVIKNGVAEAVETSVPAEKK